MLLRKQPGTVPGAPTSLSYALSGTFVTLTWTTPDDGGTELIGYKVEYSDDSDSNSDSEPIWSSLTHESNSDSFRTKINGTRPTFSFGSALRGKSIRVSVKNSVGYGLTSETIDVES